MRERARTPAHQGSPLMWFGVLGGGIAWSLHLLASYLLTESVCAVDPPRFQLLGLQGTSLLLLGITVLTALLALAAVIVGAGRWSKWRGDDENQPASYLSLTGLILSSAFLLIILVEGLPPLFLEACGS
ncbi:MAG TPA: hypothetical protein VF168_01940 [Trueperaceae bacterium]